MRGHDEWKTTEPVAYPTPEDVRENACRGCDSPTGTISESGFCAACEIEISEDVKREQTKRRAMIASVVDRYVYGPVEATKKVAGDRDVASAEAVECGLELLLRDLLGDIRDLDAERGDPKLVEKVESADGAPRRVRSDRRGAAGPVRREEGEPVMIVSWVADRQSPYDPTQKQRAVFIETVRTATPDERSRYGFGDVDELDCWVFEVKSTVGHGERVEFASLPFVDGNEASQSLARRDSAWKSYHLGRRDVSCLLTLDDANLLPREEWDRFRADLGRTSKTAAEWEGPR